MSTYVRTDGPGRLLTASGRALLAPVSAGLGARTHDMPAPGVPRAHCPPACVPPTHGRPGPGLSEPCQAPHWDITTRSSGDRDEGRALRRQEGEGPAPR